MNKTLNVSQGNNRVVNLLHISGSYYIVITAIQYSYFISLKYGFTALAEEATESKGATLLNWNDFLLEKIHSYGEALNLRGAMAPLAPYAFLGDKNTL